MEEVPKIVRERLRETAKVESHPDANLLAGFAEKSLTAREQGQVLEHLAVCAECREVVAVAAPEMEVMVAAAAAGVTRATVPAVARAKWPHMRWVTVAACAAVVAGAAFLLRSKAPTAARQVGKETVALKKETAPQAPAEAENRVEAKLQPAAPSVVSLDQEKSKLRKLSSARKARDEFRRQDLPADGRTFVTMDKAVAGPPPPPSVTPPVSAFGNDGGPVSRGASAATLAKLNEAKKNEETAGDKVIREIDGRAPASATESVEVGSTNGMVTVEAAPIAAQTGTLSTKPVSAPAMARAKRADKDAKEAWSSVTELTDLSSTTATGSFVDNLQSPFLRWTLSSDGKLLRSLDQGRTWEPAALGAAEVLRALSVTGSEVWVGGERGTLFHSSDSGTSWAQVKPAVGRLVLTSDITHIEFHDPEHGIVTTSDKQSWETSDKGRTWQKK